MIYAIASGVSLAAASMVARRIGEKNVEAAAEIAAQIILLGLIASIALGLLFGCLAPELLRLMDAERSVVAAGTDFAWIMFTGKVTVFMIYVINAVFRGASDAAIAMRALWLANGVNISLVPCFVFGSGPFPELAVTGAAAATNIGRGLGVLLSAVASRRAAPHCESAIQKSAARGARLPFDHRHRSRGDSAVPDHHQQLDRNVSPPGRVRQPNGRGVHDRSPNCLLVLLPAWGVATAAATLVGQNLGAAHDTRAAGAVMAGLRLNVALLTLLAATCVIFARPILHWFTVDPLVLEIGARGLQVVSISFPLQAAAMSLAAAFNGAGDTFTPTRTARTYSRCLHPMQVRYQAAPRPDEDGDPKQPCVNLQPVAQPLRLQMPIFIGFVHATFGTKLITTAAIIGPAIVYHPSADIPRG